MLASFLQWLFSFKFTQQSAAAVVGTGIAAAPLFGILDAKLTREIGEVKQQIDSRATIVYVDHKNEVMTISVKELVNQLGDIKKSQDLTNRQLWELVNHQRSSK